MTLRDEIANLYAKRRYGRCWQDVEAKIESENFADSILALINKECEWTMSPKDLEADKHRLFVGCRPNTIFPLAWDKIFPYCPCCGRKIEVKDS